jgi:capsular exopolysaccharide synthesis family protein
LISDDQTLKTIMVTSSDKGVGKSSVSTNLAIVMAQSDREIILMDANLRNSSIHNLMNLQNEVGLSDILSNEVKISDALHTGNGVKSSVITGGSTPANPSDLLGSKKMDHVLAELKEISDVVIIDAPPLIVSDALVLSAKVDGILLVIRLGYTSKKQVKKTMEQLDRGEVRVLGVVLTGATGRDVEQYGPDLNSTDERVNSDGRLPVVRKPRSAVVEKLGSFASAVPNGMFISSKARKHYRVQGSGPNGENPEQIANISGFHTNEDFPDNRKFRSVTQKRKMQAGKSRKGGVPDSINSESVFRKERRSKR